jgi:hypothetical protein
MQFTGTQAMTITGNFLQSDNVTMFAVAMKNTDHYGGIISSAPTNPEDSPILCFYSTTIAWLNRRVLVQQAVGNSVYRIVSGQSVGTAQQGWFDGLRGTDTTASVATNTTNTVTKIGVLRTGSTADLNGNIAEIVCYSGNLSATDRARVEAYLAQRWGITGVHRPVSQELTAVSSPLELQGCAAWLDGADSTTLYTTDAGAVTPVTFPTDITGCALWLDASDLTSITKEVGTNLVSQWNDKSGNSRHATASGSNRPTHGSVTQNGRELLSFDGTATQMQIASTFMATANVTIFAVAKYNSGTYGAIITSKGSGDTSPSIQHLNGTWQVSAVSSVATIGSASSHAVLTGVINASAPSAFQNGLFGGSNAASGTLSSDATATCIGTYRSAVANVLNGTIGEIVVFNTALSAADRARVEAYLAQRWGISGVHTQATSTNDPVGSWLDKSGNARHAKQTTGSYRPKINLAGMNGARSVQFSGGNNELLSLGDLSTAFPSAGEVIVAFEPLSDTAYGLYETSASSSYFRIANGTSYFGTFSQSRQVAVSGSAPTTGRHIASIRCSSGGQQVVRIDGVQTFTGTPQGSGYLAGTSHVIGNNNNPANDGGLTGYIAEVICYNAILSDTDRARVEKYLAAKWGISGVPDPTPPVGAWIDKSGNARHATQSTASYRPVVQTSAIASRTALKFDGSNDWLATANIASAFPSAATAFIVCYPSTFSTSNWTAFSTGANHWDVYSGALTYAGTFRSPRVNGIATSIKYNAGEPLILRYRSSSASWSQFVNGLSSVETTGSYNAASGNYSPATGNPGLGYTIGSDLSGATINGSFKDYICEVLLYNSSLSDADCKRVERQLATKWSASLRPSVSNDDAQDWIRRVYLNGGTVSASTAASVSDFCDSIDSVSGLRDRFYRLNLFAGGTSGTTAGLAACLVPLYRTPNKTVTNLFQFGTDMTNSAWLAGGNGAVTRAISTEAGPLGYGLATKLTTPSTPFDVRQMYQQMPFDGRQVTVSAWMKTNSGTRQIQWLAGNAYSDTVTVSSTWQRFTKTFTLPTSTDARTGFATVSELSDAAGFIYVWGMQCEYGAAATDYTQPVYGSTTDTNANSAFLVADYNETGPSGGLVGNGSTKYLNTGLDCGAAGLTTGSVHISSYVSSRTLVTNENDTIASVTNSAVNERFWLNFYSTATPYTAAETFLGQSGTFYARDTVSNFQNGTIPGGLWTASRTSLSAMSLYRGSQTRGSNTDTLAAAPLPSVPATVFARWNGSSAFGHTYLRHQAYSFGLGMTPEQVAAYNAAMQKFQVAMLRSEPQVSNADAQDWIARVYVNGGSVTQATADSVSAFCDSINSVSGLRECFYRLNLFCGTGLNACLVPLYRGPSRVGTQYGGTIDTNIGPFLPENYNETGVSGGLTGNGSTRYLQTGLSSSAFITGGNVRSHLAVYKRTSTNSGVLLSARSTTLSKSWEFGAGGNLLGGDTGSFAVPSTHDSLIGVTRTTSTDLVAFRGTSLASGNAASASVTGTSIPFAVFARNDQSTDTNAYTPNLFSNQTLAAYSIGMGLDATQIAAYSTAMQAFQTALTRNV